MTLGFSLGLAACGLTLAAFLMKSMLPLRAAALASNVFFIAYGWVESLLPIMVLHAVLLPLNAVRLWEIRKLVLDIQSASAESPVAEWLLPHMTRRSAQAGTTLFAKGDFAEEIFYVHTGTVRIVEYGDQLGPGALIGEIGLFAPDRRRTQSVVCDSDCELYVLTHKGLYTLYYQNPKLGFHLIGLIVGRLLRDAATQKAEPPPAVRTGTRDLG